MREGLAYFRRQKPVSSGEQVNARKNILAENMPFGGFSAGPHCQAQSAVVGGMLDSSGLAAIFAGLEPELPYLERFAGED
jgi:hypothetical protein